MQRVLTDIGWKRSGLKYPPAGMTYFDRSTLFGVLLLVWFGPFGLGCDPYSDIRAELSPAEQAIFQRGQRAATPCWSCHDLTGFGLKVGPPLAGMLGRKFGSLSTYSYSEAFRRSEGVWNRRSLDRFLADGQGSIPGNRMAYADVADPGERAALVFFLERVTPTD